MLLYFFGQLKAHLLFYKTLKLRAILFYRIKNEAYLLFSNLKFVCNFTEQKSWKSICFFKTSNLRTVYCNLKIRKPTCYFENRKLGRTALSVSKK